MKTYYLRTRSTLILFALFFALSIIPICPGICSQAYADDSWKQVMADICSKTDDAMSFSIDELKAMIEKLDKLKAVIETLEETPRKVNLRKRSRRNSSKSDSLNLDTERGVSQFHGLTPLLFPVFTRKKGPPETDGPGNPDYFSLWA
jgi:hypothetical protein